ncbi:hypothetical protein EI42_02877 [Thermosporothrix hazakensis]|uniref:Uncharacterized protein n=1 Tax=Thermosporothrix hazakensis TaxID=644383 RepID=A0A326U6K9_THEHA|nr:hypothetical protein EI42_02877 [Thermosporothrix hazakensis]
MPGGCNLRCRVRVRLRVRVRDPAVAMYKQLECSYRLVASLTIQVYGYVYGNAVVLNLVSRMYTCTVTCTCTSTLLLSLF